jgi:hypothetical protein
MGGYSPGGQPAGYNPGGPGGGYAAGPGGQAPVGGYGPGGQVGGYAPGGPPVGFGPGPGFGPPAKSGAKRGLLIGGGILAVIIVIIVIAASLSSKSTPSAGGSGGSGGSGTTQSPSPSPSPSPTPQPNPGTESLTTIMNPSGLPPVGKNCVQAPTKNTGLNAATLVSFLYCPHTSINFVPTNHIVVWAYQFDSYNDYLAGFAKLNSATGFKSAGAGENCPTPRVGQFAKTTWWADHNPKYNKSHDHGQYIECFTQYTTKHRYQPFLIWTMPSQHVVFLSRDEATGATLKQLVHWWDHVSYS